MAEIILKSMVRVPKDALSIRQIRLIRTGLCLQTQNGQTGKMEKVYGFKESTNYLYLPRQWSGSRRILKRNKIIDQRSRGSKVKLTFHSDKGWRKGQLAFSDEMVCGIRHDKLGGIGKAGCGFGKTVMGCAIAAELGVTTLVIVHTEPIMREWIEAVREFLKIEPGIIQAGRCEFEDRQVVVAMVNSLALKDYPEELYQWPGLVIFDETHHVAARMFLKALTRFPARYYCGLTATPRRQDGLENLFFWTIGGILAEGVGENLDCRVWRLRYYPKIDWDDIQDKNGRPSYSKFLKLLSEDEDRNALLARVAAKAVRQGRKVLLLTKFIDHIEDLRARIDAMFERQIHSAMFATPMEEMHHAHTTGHYLAGKTKKAKAARERARGCDVVLATDRMAKEGFNVPDLDTFILALPMKDIEQAVGRIRRLLEGKKEPTIVEIADEHPFVRGMNEERLAYYRSKLPDKSRWLVHLIK